MIRSSTHAEETLFLPLQQIRPMFETVPLANAAEAYGRMMRNEARFRIVLVTQRAARSVKEERGQSAWAVSGGENRAKSAAF